MQNVTTSLMEYFKRSKNIGEISKADGFGEVGLDEKGIATRITINIDSGHICEARFKAFGCITSIASAAAITEIIIGMSLEDAYSMASTELADILKVPDEKKYCCELAVTAVQRAIDNHKEFRMKG